MAGQIYSTKDEFETTFISISGFKRKVKKVKEFLDEFSRGLILVFAFFLLWEILPRTGIVSPILLPTFSLTVITLIDLLLSGELQIHIWASLQRSIIGFILALSAGLSLGLVMGWYRGFERYTDLLVQSMRNTSTFAMMPIFILLLGIGEASKIAIIFFGAVWPILINTISGVKGVDPLYIKAARSMGVNDRDLFRKIIFPASLPSIVSGTRLGVKTSIMVVIAAEMIAARSGLGFFIQNARFITDTPQMYAGVLTLVFLGLLANYLMIWIEKKATYWKNEHDSAIL